MAGLLAAPPVTAENATGPELNVPDPRGDMRPLTTDPTVPGVPATPVSDPFDLVGLRVHDEDAEGLHIDLAIADLKAALGGGFAGLFAQTSYNVTFELEGPSGTGLAYQLTWELVLSTPTFSGGPPPAGVAPVWTRFCLVAEGARCFQQHVVGTVDWTHSVFSAHVSRAALIGQRPAGKPPSSGTPPNLPPGIEAGSQLTRFVANSGPNFPSQLRDRIPDVGQAGPFRLQRPLAADGIRIDLDEGQGFQTTVDTNPTGSIREDYPRVPVPPQVATPVRLLVSNPSPMERTVNLSATLVGDGPGAGWGLRLLPALALPPSGSRLVNLVALGGLLELGQEQQVRVLARDAKGEEAGITLHLLAAAPPPSPRLRELRLHAAPTSVSYAAFNDALCRLPICEADPGWLNTAATDPRGTRDAGAPMEVFFSFTASGLIEWVARGSFSLDHPLPAAIVINPNERPRATIHIESTLPLSGTLVFRLRDDTNLIGAAARDFAVTGQADITADIPYAAEFSGRVAAGSTLRLEIAVTYATTTVAPAVQAADPPRFVPKASSLFLPIIPDPNARAFEIPAGPGAVSLSLQGPPERFVNPGNTSLFNFTAVNEGILEDVIHINETHANDSWSLKILPDKSFRLPSGASAEFSVLVRAPRDVPEGTSLQWTVDAASQADPRAHESLKMRSLITQGTEIPDERGLYAAHTAQALGAKERSPGLGILLLTGSIAASAFVRRAHRGP